MQSNIKGRLTWTHHHPRKICWNSTKINRTVQPLACLRFTKLCVWFRYPFHESGWEIIILVILGDQIQQLWPLQLLYSHNEVKWPNYDESNYIYRRQSVVWLFSEFNVSLFVKRRTSWKQTMSSWNYWNWLPSSLNLLHNKIKKATSIYGLNANDTEGQIFTCI